MTLADVRRMAMALHGSTESPHFTYTSFRVRGRIYATAPQDGGFLHVFVDEEDRERMVAMHPDAYQKLRWGRKILGLRVSLDKADAADIEALLQSAWRRKLERRARD
jgi:hypothetical protein